MKLSLAEPKYLKDSISIISELVNEGTFKITPDAVELVAMDPANVAMIDFKLLSSCFTEYDVKEETKISINLGNLKQILRRANPSDILNIELKDNKLNVQLKGASTRTFSLPIIDLDEKEQKVPNLEFPITINTTAEALNEAIEDVDIVADSVSFMAEPDKLTIQAEGDLSHAHIEIPKSDSTEIKTVGSSKVKAKYSIEYLKKMMNGSKLADNVSIQFNKDYPLRLSFVEQDKVALSFVLAPRVEND